MRRKLLTAAARVLPPAAFARLHCMAKLGYLPDLGAQRTFTERLLAKRVYDHDPLLAVTADKFTLRSYVEERLGDGYLPRLYAVVESAADVDVWLRAWRLPVRMKALAGPPPLPSPVAGRAWR